MKIQCFIFCIVVINNVLFTQTFNDPLKFFPAKTGDMWEYFYYDSPYSDTIQTTTTKDSSDENRNIFSWQSSYSINPTSFIGNNVYRIDTMGNVEGYWESYRGILFKLNAMQGEKWVLKKYSANAFEMIRVDSVFESYILGNYTKIKKYRRYFSNDSTMIAGLDRELNYLAYGFGLIRWQGLEGNGSYYLKGTIINGILYGDTTKIITSIFDSEHSTYLDEFNIYQNYPNPFNALTNISFQINKTSEITIKVFDVLGNKIKVLTNSVTYFPGKYNIQWDGTDESSNAVSSGIYFYQLDNQEKKSLRKMILLK